ncbi:hypothetical protein C8D92_102173 [Tamilnaduibacter salinus]|uniref:Uncharacterized protein n=1 Tax=Tamilnaduibacter salinus TaxID=1484056 RepID=A0A2U1CZD0_9GAMM|nr:hypothetical protein C8D92_102173 [Tamilnaduibacter salinus]
MYCEAYRMLEVNVRVNTKCDGDVAALTAGGQNRLVSYPWLRRACSGLR